ncbi:hypothetical protein RDI58_022663 [Solanum bulbocastanum]|uniref:Uncharacterized protein n=1 Tax=Solanum bulbocastanum TaxID=147425 RepID=A0AAN8T320_SOLBU
MGGGDNTVKRSVFSKNFRFIGYQNVEVEPSEIPLQPLSTTSLLQAVQTEGAYY